MRALSSDIGPKEDQAPPLQALLAESLSGLTLSATVKMQVPFAPALTPVAELAQVVSPGTLHSVYTLPEPAHIGWAVRPEQAELLDAINEHHAQTKRSGLRKSYTRNILRLLDFSARMNQLHSLTASLLMIRSSLTTRSRPALIGGLLLL